VVTANVATKQTAVQTFVDKDGGSYDIASIRSMSRSVEKSSVSLVIEGQVVVVEITASEAINIIELLN
jgi:hypothetical protein